MEKHQIVFIITFLFNILLVVMLIVAFWFKNKKITTLLKDWKPSQANPNTWELSIQGKVVSLYYHQGRKSKSPYFLLSVKGDYPVDCSIRKETYWDRFFKFIGINKEFQVFDPEVNSAFYFECENEDFIAALATRLEVKQLLREILSVFKKIEISKEGCKVYNFYASIFHVNPEQIKKIANLLIQFDAYIPINHRSVSSLRVNEDDYVYKKNIWLGFSWGLFVCMYILVAFGGTEYYRMINSMGFLRESLRVSLPIFAILMFIAFNQLTRHSDSAKVLIQIFFSGAFGIVLLCWIGGGFLNGYLSSDELKIYNVNIIGRDIDKSAKIDGDVKYFVKLSSSKPSLKSQSFKVSRDYYNNAKYLSPCVVETKSGFFKYEFISHWSCDLTANKKDRAP